MSLPLTPEFRLLCLSSRPAAADDIAALRHVVAATADWPAVIQGARRNRITPLLLASFQRNEGLQVPPDVIPELRRQTLASTANSLAKIPVLESLCAIFTQAKIAFLILKGIPLSVQLYGDATRRPADDIDVLVSPEQFWQADLALIQSGYRRETEPPVAARLDSYRKWVKDLRYIDERSRTVVELHHRLTANPYLLDWPFDELWKDRAHVRAGASEVPILSGSKLPLYLFTHGANHGWERLRWLVDLAAVLPGAGAIEKLVDDADRARLGPAFLQALVLANELLGLAVDTRHLEAARRNPAVKWLDFCLRQFHGRTLWLQRSQAKSWEWLWRFSIWFFIYNLSLKADWRYRRYQCAAMWVHPPDWDVVRLPAALFWLYPLVRPLAWMKRRMWR
ncbi:MAG: nucleotidyltransferase family protein [Pseudolabrys sp.]